MEKRNLIVIWKRKKQNLTYLNLLLAQQFFQNSFSNIARIAEETSEEIIKQIINVEINKSNVSAIANDIAKKEMEKNT